MHKSVAAVPGVWSPVLDGALGERALAAARRLGDSLRGEVAAIREGRTPVALAPDLALLFGYLDVAFPGGGYDVVSDEALQLGAEWITGQPTPLNLHGGLLGVAWASNHLEADSRLDLEEIDDLTAALTRPTRWAGDFDLITGLVGMGVYALDRLARPAAVTITEQVIEHLSALAEQRPAGLCWLTPPSRIPEAARWRFPEGGHYNLGFSHGIGSIVAYLARAAGRGFTAARPLLVEAARWLVAQDRPSVDLAACRFGSFVELDGTIAPSRTGWCYGDPGASVALQAAAVALEDPALAARADEVARRALVQRANEGSLEDATLCHGTAGLMHLGACWRQWTGDATYAAAAVYWTEKTLADIERPGTYEDNGILLGEAGICLALLAAATAIPPAWDRLLLLH
jgi:hypothetical protein